MMTERLYPKVRTPLSHDEQAKKLNSDYDTEKTFDWVKSTYSKRIQHGR